MKLAFSQKLTALSILMFASTGTLAVTNRTVLSKSVTETNIHEKITTLDLDKDGTQDFRRNETWRGNRLIITTIWQAKTVTRVFHIGDFVFLEHDANGDGLFEEVSILKDNDVIDAFIRSSDGNVTPLPTDRLHLIQSSCAEARNLMTNLVNSVTNKNTEKAEQIIKEIRKREQHTGIGTEAKGVGPKNKE